MPPSLNQPNLALAVVLLAAGRSVRMGQPKLLLPWGSTTILGHLIQQWESLDAARIAVVCAADDTAITKELDRLEFPEKFRIYNPVPELGMFSSIQCAAAWKGWDGEKLSHWAIALGDQPHLRAETLLALVEFTAKHSDKICLPRHGGHRRHPVLVPKYCWRQLADSPARDLKQFLDSHADEIAICDLEDAGLELDIDRPEDYEKAVRLKPQISDRSS
jgi:molybdenum cofactor cytidylyltransferase